MTPTSTSFKKMLLLCAIAATFATNNVRAQVFISESFDAGSNPGLPPGWTSSPALMWTTGVPNIITPNAFNNLHYSLNSATHTKALGIDGTQAAADAAIIASPVISLPASATDAIVKFDVAYFGIQSNNNPPETESLIFIISTNGGASWTDVSFVAPVSNPPEVVWETRSIPMGAYAGQNNLKFGFRYNNQGGVLIGATLDNIRLINGVDGTVISAYAGDHPDPSTGTGYQLSGSGTTLTGTVQNSGSVAINNYYIKYKVGNGAVQSSPLIATALAPLATASFPSGLTVAIPSNDNYVIKAWIQAAGDVDHNNDTISSTTVGVPYLPVKRPVFEEGTGTWCGWCPRGAVFMDAFADSHSNGAASQIAVHDSDPMTVQAYNDYIVGTYAVGFPNLITDRFSVKDPRSIDTVFASAQNNFGFADVTIGTPLINGNTVLVPVSIKPVVAISNPKLALVVTESNVRGTGGNWPQNNYYAGGGSGAMDGWESEADHVADVYFHFVARSISPSASGDAGHLPATLAAGITYKDTLTTALDAGWKINDLQYLVLLLNGNNASVMNSASTQLPTLTPSLGNPTAITNAGIDIEQAAVYPNPTSDKSYLNVKIKNAGKATLSISDIAGRILLKTEPQLHSGNNIIEMQTGHLAAGSYFVNFTTGKSNAVLRLQVAR